jgi:hypothetical protein
MKLLSRSLTARICGLTLRSNFYSLAMMLISGTFLTQIWLTNAFAQVCPEQPTPSCPAPQPVPANCSPPDPTPICPPVQTVVACSTATPVDTATPVPTGVPDGCLVCAGELPPHCIDAGCSRDASGLVCCFPAPYQICANCDIT